MTYLWIAGGAALIAAGAARLIGRPRHAPAWASVGGLVVGVAGASQPTLFRAENGFVPALVAFTIPAVALALAIGMVVRTVPGQYSK